MCHRYYHFYLRKSQNWKICFILSINKMNESKTVYETNQLLLRWKIDRLKNKTLVTKIALASFESNGCQSMEQKCQLGYYITMKRNDICISIIYVNIKIPLEKSISQNDIPIWKLLVSFVHAPPPPPLPHSFHEDSF